MVTELKLFKSKNTKVLRIKKDKLLSVNFNFNLMYK